MACVQVRIYSNKPGALDGVQVRAQTELALTVM